MEAWKAAEKVLFPDRDVTVADLQDWTRGPLAPILAALREQWVGDQGKRATSVRCGTVRVEDATGNRTRYSTIRIDLRFSIQPDPPTQEQ